LQAEFSESERKNNLKVKIMTVKKFYIGLSVSIITFIIGFIMINNNFGKLSLLGFGGYALCAVSLIVLLSTFVVAIVLNGEEKNK